MTLISPHGGTLVNLFVDSAHYEELKQEASALPHLTLTDRFICDLEMLANGGFSPLRQFMGSEDYKSVLRSMRLADGTLFPVPITLPVDHLYQPGTKVALRDGYGNLLAIMTVEEQYEWDKKMYAESLLGSNDSAHPLQSEIETWGKYNVSGKLQVLALPSPLTYADLRLSPEAVRSKVKSFGNDDVVAFQTRNPLHRAHEELTKRAAKEAKATLLLHPVVGLTKPGDIDAITRVRCYKALVEHYYGDYDVILALLPLAMRMAGPREALWHAIIRKNYGANHFIVGRDHAGPGNNSAGRPFYAPYDAQVLVKKHEEELGMSIICFNEMVYVNEIGEYREANEVADDQTIQILSGTQVREQYLARNRTLPTWFTRPEVASILMDANVPRHRQGYCLWFTGLSGAGKSTIANAIEGKLNEAGRTTTTLDGDIVRSHLSKGLGFSREDRDENVKRIGFVASEVVKHNGVAICAAISPYAATREIVRSYFETDRFFEIHVSTPIEVCQTRDPKGLYVLAKEGKLQGFTGVDDTYQAPTAAELTVDTSRLSIEEAASKILILLESRGFYKHNQIPQDATAPPTNAHVI